ncbi:hypothetical protein FRB99_001020 [Tulasnella sp. 403]|nr:hypothetical protein FRB99_001020 [Tulasnella sp. 403]
MRYSFVVSIVAIVAGENIIVLAALMGADLTISLSCLFGATINYAALTLQFPRRPFPRSALTPVPALSSSAPAKLPPTQVPATASARPSRPKSPSVPLPISWHTTPSIPKPHAFLAVFSCGTDTTCLCTSSIAQALQACAKCGAAQAPSSATMLQNSLTQYSGGCQTAGKPVGTLTIGAVDSSAPASTGAASTPASTPAGVSTSRAASTPLVASTPGASTSRPLSVAQFSSSSPTSTRPLTGVPTGTAAANPVGGAGSGSAAAPGAKASVLGMGLVAGVAAAFVGLF